MCLMQAKVGEPLVRKTNLPSLFAFLHFFVFIPCPSQERTWGGKSDLMICVRTKVLFYKKFGINGVMWLPPKINSLH